MLAQPVRHGVGLTVAEQVDGPAGLDVDQDGAVVPAAAEREVVDPHDRQGPACGSGSAMTRRSMLDRPAVRPSAAASRAPARPARASAIAVSARASGGVRRERREVRPLDLLGERAARQPGVAQKNRRTISRIRTRLPPIAASASRRW